MIDEGGATSGQVLLSCIKKQAHQVMPPGSCLQVPG